MLNDYPPRLGESKLADDSEMHRSADRDEKCLSLMANRS